MAVLRFYQPANMSNPYVWHGYVDFATPTSIHLTDSAGNSGTYYGSFTYDSNYLTGGTVTAYENYANYQLDYTITNVALDAISVNNFLASGNAIGLQQYALSGNDTIFGTASADILFGWAGNDFLNGGGGADRMAGGLGNDVYVVDNAGDVVTEGLNAGTDQVNANVSYVLGANLERLTLTGAAAINGTGNALNNALTGNAAANFLNGGAGADTMAGGLGNDVYVVDSVGDVVTEGLNGGTDQVNASVSYVLGANMEALVLAGAAAINGTGNALNNTLTGNAAANVLNGGAGADAMAGGLGNDIYVVDNVGDVVTEGLNGGTDQVNTSISYVLGANLERLTLTGAAAITGTGNELNNVLVGNAAANFLNGGIGADTMAGGLGNDVYIVDNVGDVVTEGLNAGTDRVYAYLNYVLGANVEQLILSGADPINGTGNALNNTLTGNAAANTLNGGAGADAMAGGLGNDVYVLDNVGDGVTEGLNAGTDRVYAYLNHVLGANVEQLFLSGAAAINGTGNALNNMLIGNAAANTLSGGGGSDLLDGRGGVDTLSGGSGDDTYIVDLLKSGNTAVLQDSITEALNAGNDTLALRGALALASATTLTLGSNLENLDASATGATLLNLTGNTLNNTLTGNPANNVLNGGAGNDTLIGGLGRDTLTGDIGSDSFVFDSLPGDPAQADLVTDFVSGIDHLAFDTSLFTALAFNPDGSLAAGQFVSGAGVTAVDANSHLLYDTSTGNLFYDTDGNGVDLASLIATLGTETRPVIAASDFMHT